jgi:hypothetical protein
MNIKSLAFETNPINKGNAVSAFTLPDLAIPKSEKSDFMKEIEERLKARAGNLPLKDSYLPVKPASTAQRGEQAGLPKKEQPASDHSKPKTEEKKPKVLGSGITEEEVDRMIREFKAPSFSPKG